MKNYRLKKEAVQFFKDKYATSIYPLDTWDDIGVDIIALEEVEEMYIEYGHYSLNGNGSSLSGWGEKGTYFHFTITFPSVKYNEHDKFNNGKTTRDLMNRIQNQINYFYQEFVNDES